MKAWVVVAKRGDQIVGIVRWFSQQKNAKRFARDMNATALGLVNWPGCAFAVTGVTQGKEEGS